MAHVITKRILLKSALKPQSLIIATSLGALNETEIYLDALFKDGFGSPRSFIASVHNSMAGKLAIDFSIHGPNITVCEGQNSFASALKTGSLLTEDDNPILLIVVDEKVELFTRIRPYLSEDCKKFNSENWEEAAVAFLLNVSENPEKPYMVSTCSQPVQDARSPESKYAGFVSQNNNNNVTALTLMETSDSFSKAAVSVYDLINGSQTDTFTIATYSPSARAVAVVTICI